MKRRRRVALSVLLMLILVLALAIPGFAKPKKAKIKPILNETAITISVGEAHQLSVLNNVKVKWKSSKKKIASVKGGLVVGKKVGKTVITAKAGSKKAKCTVIVVAAPVIQTYVLNTNTMKFHYPKCYSVTQIAPENRQDTTMSREEIIAKGFSPCGNCHP